MEKVTVHSRSREIAEAAAKEAPGQWTHPGLLRVLGSRPCSCGECGENETVARTREIPVAAHIAHFHPARVIALLDVVDAAAELLPRLGPDGHWMLVGITQALARLNALDEADDE